MNKNSLKEILQKINTLDRSIPIGETQSYLDQMVSKETKRVSESVKNNPTIKFLDDLNTKLEKFKKNFNLKPVLDTIQEIQNDISETKEAVGSEFESIRGESEQKLSELTELVTTIRKEFTTLSKDSFETITDRIAALQGELSFTSEESDKKGQTLKQVLDDYEARLKSLAENSEASDTDRGELRSVLTMGFSERDDKIKTTVDSVEALRRDMNSRLASWGGGQANREIKINSSVMSTKYTDINLIGTITKSDNNTTKQVDITFAGGGSGSQDFLTVKEADGNPNVGSVVTIVVTNGTLTDDGGGQVTIATGGGGSGITRTTSIITANTAAGATAATDYVFIATAGLAFTLPDAAGNTNLYTLKNATNSSVLVTAVGGDTIDGSSSVLVAINNQALDFTSDGTNYRIV